MSTSAPSRLKEPLHVLFTILGYAWRSGSETHVRDLAVGLTRRGHRVTIFAPTVGEMALEARRHGVAVVDCVADLKAPPDLIHANHVLPIAEALLAFPQTRALWTCHDRIAWHDEPPLFPQILRYAGVDEICLERIRLAGIDSNHSILLPNGVDLLRIPDRPAQLASRPLSAAVFGKANAVAPLVASACRHARIRLTAIGGAGGPVKSEPESELVCHDIVFATARAASEAIACGCAVVLVDARGFGGLVSLARYESMRANNFGLRCLAAPPTVEALGKAIREYDPGDALAVSKQHREERNIERVLDELEQTYAQMLAEPLSTYGDGFMDALAVYLRQFTPHPSPEAKWPWHRERIALQARIADLEEQVQRRRPLAGLVRRISEVLRNKRVN
jgi:hypothetical protein